MPIYSWHIVVVHLVFSLSENRFIWSNLRSKLGHGFGHIKACWTKSCVRFSSKEDKATDFKSYARLLLIYCSCAPHIQFVRKSIYLVKFWGQNLDDFKYIKSLLNEVLCALLLQRDKAVDFKTYTDLLLTYCSCAPCIQFVRKSIYLVKFEVKTLTILST